MKAFKAVVLLLAFVAAVAFAQPAADSAPAGAGASANASAGGPAPARPKGWLLLLSGVLVAGWVAHRRLLHNF